MRKHSGPGRPSFFSFPSCLLSCRYNPVLKAEEVEQLNLKLLAVHEDEEEGRGRWLVFVVEFRMCGWNPIEGRVWGKGILRVLPFHHGCHICGKLAVTCKERRECLHPDLLETPRRHGPAIAPSFRDLDSEHRAKRP